MNRTCEWTRRGGAAAAAWAGTVALLIAMLGTAAMAQDTPTTASGAKTVSAEEVKRLMGQGARVFDLRKKASYVEKHIPGAVYLKFDENSVKAASYDPKADAFDLGQLPSDKNAKVIFHGHGTDGWKGYKASIAAAKAGYKNVYFFRGGFAEWVAKGLPTE
jgi:rhodanese-related sulfurtransferase